MSHHPWGISPILISLVAAATAFGESNVTDSERLSDEAESQTAFAFDIFSDIAPILALFGEQFATQYLSQSFSWLDHIIFACVPLGILTTLSAAIRVQGALWMRSFIGRARDSRATAEIELMSSTSSEVCELFNGHHIIRAIGRPKIAQIIIFPYINHEDESYGIYTLEKAVENQGNGKKPEMTHNPNRHQWQLYCRCGMRQSHAADTEGGAAEKAPKRSLDFLGSPNIQINLRSGNNSSQKGAAKLCLAMIGVFLQISVIAIAVITVAHEQTRIAIGFQPEKHGLWSYLTGSVAIFLSMLICSHAIERSTIEHKWRRNDPPSGEKAMELFWIQKAQNVSDQSFDSFIIIGGAKEAILTSSRRELVPAAEKKKSCRCVYHSSRASTPEGPSVIHEKTTNTTSTKWVITTLVGVGLGVFGFGVQYIGLRGLAYPVSLSHLLAILIMALVRAFIRRRLGHVPIYLSALPGRELESFAYQLTMDQNHGLRKSRNVSSTCSESSASSIGQWRISTICMMDDAICAPPDKRSSLEVDSRTTQPQNMNRKPSPTSLLSPVHTGEQSAGGGHSISPNWYHNESSLSSQHLVQVRRRLGDLCRWRTRETELALALGRGMENFLNNFTPEGVPKQDSFNWRIPCTVHGTNVKEDVVSVDFKLDNNECTGDNLAKWKVDIGLLEAILSLWIASIEARRPEDTQEDSKLDWTREASSKVQYRRVLGKSLNDGILERDISWWSDQDLSVSNRQSSSPPSFMSSGQTAKITIGFHGPNVKKFRDRIDGKSAKQLEVTSSEHLPNILAQHLFTSFMWQVASTLPKDALRLKDFQSEKEVEIRNVQQYAQKSTTGGTTWTPCKLAHPRLCRVVASMESEGLGTFDDLLLCIVPALSWEGLLPNERILDLLPLPHSGSDWEWDLSVRRFKKALAAHTANEERREESLTHALVVKTMRLIMLACVKAANDSSFSNKSENWLPRLMSDLLSETKENLQFISSFYALQKKENEVSNFFSQLTGETKMDLSFFTNSARLDLGDSTIRSRLAALEFSKDHEMVYNTFSALGGSNESRGPRIAFIPKVPLTEDLFGWTPLHYVVAQPSSSEKDVRKIIKAVRQNGQALDQPTASGCCEGPGLFHLATQAGSQTTLKVLLEEHMKPGCLDFVGLTPFSYVAGQNSQEIMSLLLDNWDNLELRDVGGWTCLHWAIPLATNTSIKKLVGRKGIGRIVDVADTEGKTPLHIASQQGKLDVLRLLINRKATLDSPDLTGRTALHYAKGTVNPSDIVQEFRQRGANMTFQDNMGRTPLHHSLLEGEEGVAIALLDCKEVSPFSRDHAQATPIMLACQAGLENFISKAVGKDGSAAGLFYQDENGQSCLHYAALCQHGIEVLLHHLGPSQSDINAADGTNTTPLLHAIIHGEDKNAVALLQKGADARIGNGHGKFPLHEAISNKCYNVISYLSNEEGDIINEIAASGRTVLSSACESGDQKLVEALLEHGCSSIDINLPRGSLSPLHTAIDQGHAEIVRILLQDHRIDRLMRDDQNQNPMAAAADRSERAIVSLLTR